MISQDEFLDFAKTVNILYVEDNITVQESMMEILKSIFKNITIASDGEEGLKKFEAIKDDLDIILSDINMPKMDGIEMSKRIKEQNNDISIIFLTAFSDTNKLLKSIDIGVEGYIIKPLEYKKFISIIKKVVERIYLQKLHKDYKNMLEERVKFQTLKLVEQTKQLEYKYYHDELTGLKNRQAFIDDILKYDIQEIMVLDINKFSTINNIYGENVGDKVLIKFSNILQQDIGELYNIYKISADQFLIAKNMEENIDFKAIANNLINKTLSTPVIVNLNSNDTIKININITIAIVEGVEKSKLLEYADMTIKHAKQTYQQLMIYIPSLNIEKTYYKAINAINNVKMAIQTDNLIPFFQPIIKNSEISYECLARIVNKDNILTPYFFLEEIKHTPYYAILTKLMIKKSFEYFKNRPNSFSINISFKDISNHETIEYLKNTLEKTGMNNQLTLEILESEIIENFDIAKKFIMDMKKMGVKIALDDFGSGYSNFVYLHELNPDYLKIDGSLIKDIDTNKKSYTIVKTIVSFANELNIKTIAEYVHNENVYKTVKSLGLYGFQGYFLGEPKDKIKDREDDK